MPSVPEKVVLHPLVLLSVVDNYNRVAKDTRKRVVGLLLGELSRGVVDITNSFASACVVVASASFVNIARTREQWLHLDARKADTNMSATATCWPLHNIAA
jgi:hypothetical protein